MTAPAMRAGRRLLLSFVAIPFLAIAPQRGIAAANNMKTGLPLKPAALGDAIPEIAADEDPRLRLADWIGTKQNPFFAKSLPRSTSIPSPLW